jgi:uncharacterized FlaG/YvyC family protein
MTAVSFTTMPSSANPALVPLAPRAGDAAVTAVKSESPVSEAVKSAAQENSATATVAKSPVKPLSKAELTSQVHELQAKMDKLNPALAFVVDQSSGRALIQLTDRATKEVILQFPTATTIQIGKALDRFEKGQLLNRTA